MSTRPLYSAAELAGLPGMPATKRGVQVRAEAESWPYQDEPGRGGVRRLYLTDQLPATTRAALAWNTTNVIAGDDGQATRTAAQVGGIEGAKGALQQDITLLAGEATQTQSLKTTGGLSLQAQRRMDARLAVLGALERHVRAGNVYSAAEYEVAAAYRQRALALPAWVYDELGTISAKSLQTWRLGAKKSGVAFLAGAYGNRKGDSKIHRQDQLREFVTAMLVRFPHARAPHVMQAVKARMAGDMAAGDVTLPSIRSLGRWIEQWRSDNKEVLTALTNPDKWKNQNLSAFGSLSDGIERPNQKWELDSTPGDVMLSDGRHSIIGVIDVHNRRFRMLVSKTSKSVAVAALIRRAILDWGVPEVAKTDNGADYVSKHIRRVFKALDVDHQTCAPFQPWQKGHIERAFGTFTRDLVELLPNFIGHNVAERAAIEARTSFADRLMKRGEVVPISMASTDFQEFCDRWCDDLYLHNPHSQLNNRTPFEVFNSYTGRVRTIGDERALDILLAEAPGSDGGMCTVQKRGVRVDSAYFIAPELEAYVGQRVMVRYDALEHDLGRMFVFGGDDLHFLCVAECPERTGIDRREIAIKARSMQTKRVQEERKALKAAAKKMNVDDIAQEILRERATAAGKLRTLPRPTDQHQSAGLTAAAEAVAEVGRDRGTSADVLNNDRVRSLWQEQRKQAQAAADEAGVGHGNANELASRRAAAGVVTPQFDDKHQRTQWVLKEERTRELTGEERDFLAGYKKDHPGSYRRMVEMVDGMFANQKKADPEENGAN